MIIFLAGGVTGNLSAFFTKLSQSNVKEAMDYYLAGSQSRKYLFDMNIYLAGNDGYHRSVEFLNKCPFSLKEINILESYYYLKDNEHFMRLVPNFGNFLLDSGAFTFLQNSHKENIDWEQYVRSYAEFINQYDIKLFFELDIDALVGLEKVEYYRKLLEHLTKKKPIPVWHKNRSKEYFVEMCKNYPYVALGGIVIKEIPREKYERVFPWFIKTAHQYGCKIHGLGYTSIAGLHKYHFDSVDSTAWLYGNRGGYLYKFNPNNGMFDKFKKDGRLKSRESAMFNFNEWIKFIKYANIKL